MNIFFDLDGTIIDSRLRLYSLFQDLVPESELDFENYWILKRNKKNHENILRELFSYSEFQIKNFEEQWMKLIEDSRYLKLDSLFSFTINTLKRLSKTHQLYIVTARQNKDALMLQLNNLGLPSYFKDVLLTEAKTSKAELINKMIKNIEAEDILVGDTGEDVLAAKEIGCRGIAVLSGFRNRAVLLEYKPDFIENDIQTIIKYV